MGLNLCFTLLKHSLALYTIWGSIKSSKKLLSFCLWGCSGALCLKVNFKRTAQWMDCSCWPVQYFFYGIMTYWAARLYWNVLSDSYSCWTWNKFRVLNYEWSNSYVNGCGYQLALSHVLTGVLFLIYSTWGQRECQQASFTLWIPYHSAHRSHLHPPQALWHVPGSPLDMAVPIFFEGFEDHGFTIPMDLSSCCSLLCQIVVVTLCFLWSPFKPC